MNESNEKKAKGLAFMFGYYGTAVVFACGLVALIALTIKFVSWLLF